MTQATDILSAERIAEIRDEWDATTKGEWVLIPNFRSTRIYADNGEGIRFVIACHPAPKKDSLLDATFCANAHNKHIPALLASHDAQAAEIARLREALEACVDIIEEAQVCIGAGEMDTAALKLAKAALKGPRDE